MRPALTGTLAMVGACTIWGLSAIYYKLLAHVPPAEVLAHRTIWSALFFAAVLAGRGRLSSVARLARGPQIAGLVTVAAIMIASNWFCFIFAVQAGHVVEASLGYFIFPLVSVALGAAIFRERPTRAQGGAIALAAVGVGTLIVGLGAAPWVSFALAITFGFYGVAKKAIEADAMASVTAEVALLSPLALGWLVWAVPGWGAFTGRDAFLLVASGPITGLPLILFTVASRRLSLSGVGVIGYLNPTLQFFCATVLFGERFTPWHAAAFGAIWIALAIYSGEAIVRRRRVRAAPPAP
ncbi:EamA family transporter RarD [Palleronia sp.]|uniref:EamA family transporter RarD n=1 Tax=Palleronia sp. TaxID=1940284 RepID=UPI0035C812F5